MQMPSFVLTACAQAPVEDSRVTISCLVSDLEYRWQLSDAGEETDIEVQVTMPDAEAHRLPAQRDLLTESIGRLAALAVSAASAS
jgi:hypothetical protein